MKKKRNFAEELDSNELQKIKKTYTKIKKHCVTIKFKHNIFRKLCIEHKNNLIRNKT